jgi:hypothetical protein
LYDMKEIFQSLLEFLEGYVAWNQVLEER